MSRMELNRGNPQGGFSFHDKEKLIIDYSYLGIEASMTVMMAFQSPELEIVGITTIFGNSCAKAATRNALLLCEMAGYPDVPVAEGNPEPLKGGKPLVPDFIQESSDEPNNSFYPPPKGKGIEKTATEFLVETVCRNPSHISILALGPLTNLALAVKRDSSFAFKVKKLFFLAYGNVNPAAENKYL